MTWPAYITASRRGQLLTWDPRAGGADLRGRIDCVSLNDSDAVAMIHEGQSQSPAPQHGPA